MPASRLAALDLFKSGVGNKNHANALSDRPYLQDSDLINSEIKFLILTFIKQLGVNLVLGYGGKLCHFYLTLNLMVFGCRFKSLAIETCLKLIHWVMDKIKVLTSIFLGGKKIVFYWSTDDLIELNLGM